MKTIGSVLKRLLIALGGSADGSYYNDITLVDKIAELVENNQVKPGLINFPVGYIYLSFTDTNPSTVFGGTWERIQDVFLLAAGQTYAAGSTGGEADHMLTVAEMPEHEHDGIYWGVDYKETPYPWGLNNDGIGNGFSSTYSGTRGGPNEGHAMYTGKTGENQPHNNMPPYLAVYAWRKTA